MIIDPKDFFKKELKNPTIIEAGTSTGYDTLEFSQTYPKGKIYGFEPIPNLYNLAKERLKNQENVFLYNKALSDKKGYFDMYVSEMFNETVESSSLLKPKEHLKRHPNIIFNETIKVETIILDDFIDEEKIEFIDLMWLDLQGYESFVLKSSPKTLTKTNYIYSEVSVIDTYENVVRYKEFDDLMNSLGFNKIWDDLKSRPNTDMANSLYKKI